MYPQPATCASRKLPDRPGTTDHNDLECMLPFNQARGHPASISTMRFLPPTVKTTRKVFSLRESLRMELLHASPFSPLTKAYTSRATVQTPATFLALRPPHHWTTCLWTSTLSHRPISNIMRPSRHLAIATLHTRGPYSVDLVRHRIHNTYCNTFALFMLDTPCYLLNLLYIIIIRYYTK